MDRESILKKQKKLNVADNFFEALEFINDGAFGKGSIPKKYKELMGLALAIVAKSDEAIVIHLGGCKDADCTKLEIVETIKIAVATGGNFLLPWASRALKFSDELGIE